MANSQVNEKAKAIEIKANSKKEFFLLHGYTGSPTDFNQLGKYLNKRFNANVKIIRLKGHGERIENLKGLEYKDFLLQANKELKKDIKKGMKIVLGGVSIGSFIALQLSTKYHIQGLLLISTPYKPRYLTAIVSFLEPIIFKKHWKKPVPKYQLERSKDAFYYDASITGLKIVKQAKRAMKPLWKKVAAPCFIFHVAQEVIFHPDSAEIIKNKICSKVKKVSIFKSHGRLDHNPFFSPLSEDIYKTIGDFVEKNKLFNP